MAIKIAIDGDGKRENNREDEEIRIGRLVSISVFIINNPNCH
jgi:hypothetical protein